MALNYTHRVFLNETIVKAANRTQTLEVLAARVSMTKVKFLEVVAGWRVERDGAQLLMAVVKEQDFEFLKKLGTVEALTVQAREQLVAGK